ncbi:MAG TPA: 16S rRNA (uracil(1498)-N(3))-methyltransferase [Steroidobacteraceae bacterium]|nr:16S rRNA (uracil(1498)-N(3))-methyltransferase [Steroidobacteraceae bacterium]
MRLSRVFVAAPLESGARVTLAGDAASHVTRVLRLRPGAPLALFNGTGGEYSGTIAAIRAGTVTVTVGEAQRIERESPLRVTLAQGVSRGERMDLVVQKATELGVSRILPVFTARSVVKLEGHKAARRLEHWRAIAIGACEQSGRNRPPEVSSPVDLEELLRAERTGTRLLLSPAAALRVAQVARPEGAVLVLIGPEGGLAEEEQQRALAAGFLGVRLGPRVLRTETAAIAALVLLQREFGDL